MVIKGATPNVSGTLAGGTGESAAPARCRGCGGAIGAADRYCRHCGTLLIGTRWYYGHAGIIIMTLAAGPLALYFVWRSPKLSAFWKWAYTGLICLFTWFLIDSVLNFWKQVESTFGDLKQIY